MLTFSRIVAALLIAIGIALAGWLGGQALIESRQPIRTVTVKGLSERNVMANIAHWPIKFVATGPTLEDARAQLEASDAAVREFLTGAGFPEDAMNVQNILVEDRLAGYNASGTPDEARFVLTEEFIVTSEDVEAIATASRNIGDLLRAGVVFSSDSYNAGPSYIFTALNDLKTDMLAEATQRAREAAEQFAAEAGAEVGTIQTANQGVFEILAAVEIPDQRPEKQMEKKVRVVTTITYFLE
ncbi:SIMPL domain-containing protein [Pelagibacterium sp. 26DY04]|uniref:SIMPL domain-containing protein n=1 Tax=Pelagibacterium sp. 26DY04 TaxID=2967130 RepID=UPI002814ABA7|nr:SIMPL domain-containing protein [Pelagibacterium sp. 26DY04]WMT87360.1 SIMPL domain-containing protein [Pelagibacterium sp. 26DY04]